MSALVIVTRNIFYWLQLVHQLHTFLDKMDLALAIHAVSTCTLYETPLKTV